MAEYIKREAAYEDFEKCNSENPKWTPDRVKTIIARQKAADVAPVRHGEWADNHCTACGMMPMGDEMWKNCDFEPPLFERFMDYCPSCGAKMDGGETND